MNRQSLLWGWLAALAYELYQTISIIHCLGGIRTSEAAGTILLSGSAVGLKIAGFQRLL